MPHKHWQTAAVRVGRGLLSSVMVVIASSGCGIAAYLSCAVISISVTFTVVTVNAAGKAILAKSLAGSIIFTESLAGDIVLLPLVIVLPTAVVTMAMGKGRHGASSRQKGGHKGNGYVSFHYFSPPYGAIILQDKQIGNL